MPLATISAGTSVRSRSVTRGLTGVTNGSPTLRRSNGVARLTHGTQRYMSVTPLARVNSHVEPPVVDRSVARNGTTTLTVTPVGSRPPNGTVIVWSAIVAVTGRPSTVTWPNARLPSGPIVVLSRTRSTGWLMRLVAVIVTVPRRARAAIRRVASTS